MEPVLLSDNEEVVGALSAWIQGATELGRRKSFTLAHALLCRKEPKIKLGAINQVLRSINVGEGYDDLRDSLADKGLLVPTAGNHGATVYQIDLAVAGIDMEEVRERMAAAAAERAAAEMEAEADAADACDAAASADDDASADDAPCERDDEAADGQKAPAEVVQPAGEQSSPVESTAEGGAPTERAPRDADAPRTERSRTRRRRNKEGRSSEVPVQRQQRDEGRGEGRKRQKPKPAPAQPAHDETLATDPSRSRKLVAMPAKLLQLHPIQTISAGLSHVKSVSADATASIVAHLPAQLSRMGGASEREHFVAKAAPKGSKSPKGGHSGKLEKTEPRAQKTNAKQSAQDDMARVSAWVHVHEGEQVPYATRRQRAYQIFDDEKALEGKRGERLMKRMNASGMNPMMLRISSNQTPVLHGFYGIGSDRPFIVVENIDVYEEIVTLLKGQRNVRLFGKRVGGVIFGAGHNVCIAHAIDDFLHDIGYRFDYVYYAGDVDREGARLVERAREVNVIDIRLHTGMYRAMFAANRAHVQQDGGRENAAVNQEAPRDFARLVKDLPVPLRLAFKRALRDNIRIPQEVLTSDDYRRASHGSSDRLIDR